MEPSKHNILPKMQRELHAANIRAYDTVLSAGLYFDGAQHGELIPCVFISSLHMETGVNAETIERIIKKHIRHTDYILERVPDMHYTIYRVLLETDRERANKLNQESSVFLEAFWQCIHDNPHARDNNAEHAITAGRAAVAAMA